MTDTGYDIMMDPGQSELAITDIRVNTGQIEELSITDAFEEENKKSDKIIHHKKEKKKKKKVVNRQEEVKDIRNNFTMNYSIDNCSDYSVSDESDGDNIQDYESKLTDVLETKQPTLPLEDLVPVNSAMFDNRSLYLKPINPMTVQCPSEIHKELLDNLDYCNELFKIYIYCKVHENHSQIRYKTSLGMMRLQRLTQHAEISGELNMFIKVLGETAYRLLIDNQVMGDSVELQVEQRVCVLQDGSSKCVCVTTDLVSCHYNIPQSSDSEQSLQTSDTTTNQTDQEQPPNVSVSVANSDTYTCESDSKSETETSATKETDSKSECRTSTTSSTDTSKPDRKHDIVSVVLLLTPRQSVPAMSVLQQYFMSMLQMNLTTYILACHIGPLVDQSQIVLYEYRARTRGQTLEGKDIDSIMRTWARCEGRLVFPVTPLTELARHSIYHHEGLTKKQHKKRRNVIKIYVD